MKKKIKIISLLSISCLVVLFFLYQLSLPDEELKNGFDRNFDHKQPELIYISTLSHNQYYFAGWAANKFFLGAINSPGLLVEISEGSFKEVKIPLPEKISRGQFIIDSISVFLADLNTLRLYRANHETWQWDEVEHARQPFTEYVPLNSHSIAFRIFNSERTEFLLSKKSPLSGIITNPLFLQKQGDGIFSVDGILRYDRFTNRLAYTYFYRNEFICADTNLQVLYRTHTIDTIRQSKIKVATDQQSLSSPPFVVNRRAFADYGRLYINSNLKANNEDKQAFRNSNVIDVYNLLNGLYMFSFYIQKTEGERLRHFAVYNNLIYVLTDKELRVFRLPS